LRQLVHGIAAIVIAILEMVTPVLVEDMSRFSAYHRVTDIIAAKLGIHVRLISAVALSCTDLNVNLFSLSKSFK
jgi:hypothetical protein